MPRVPSLDYLAPVPSANDVINSNALTNLTEWASFRSAVLTRDLSSKVVGATSVEIVTPGTLGDEGAEIHSTPIVVLPNTQYTYSAFVYGTTSDIHLNVNELTAAEAYIRTEVGATYVFDGSVARLALTFTTGATTEKVSLFVLTKTIAAITFYASGLQWERLGYASPLIVTDGAAVSRPRNRRV